MATDKEKVVKRLVGKTRCPKCNAEVDFLKNYASGENYYIFDEDGHYEEQEFQPDGKTDDYECPYCAEILFTDEEKARRFLSNIIPPSKDGGFCP